MDLAAWARDRLTRRVVGITGSVGKTSTKDLVRRPPSAPSRRVAANERSFNNEQGLPVTILGAPDDAEVLVLEMGMRGFGEIAAAVRRRPRPTIGVVTAVGRRRTPSSSAASTAWRGPRPSSSRRCPATARPCSTPTTSGSRAMAAGPHAARRLTFGHVGAADVRAERARARRARPAPFRVRHAVGDGAGAPRRAAAPTWRSTPPPRSPSPARRRAVAARRDGARHGVALGDAHGGRRAAAGRARDQRRLQRQPDVDGRRARGAGRAADAGRRDRGARRDGRARRPRRRRTGVAAPPAGSASSWSPSAPTATAISAGRRRTTPGRPSVGPIGRRTAVLVKAQPGVGGLGHGSRRVVGRADAHGAERPATAGSGGGDSAGIRRRSHHHASHDAMTAPSSEHPPGADGVDDRSEDAGCRSGSTRRRP